MKKIYFSFTANLLAVILLLCAEASAASLSLLVKGGYAPELGGSLHSSWQSENLGVMDGINEINRSQDGMSVSTIESPLGALAGAEARIAGDSFYFKSGIDYITTFSGGTGSTLHDFGAGVEKVDVEYSVWFLYVPVTAGVRALFWNEAAIYIGCGVAFAYGNYSNSFSSASAEHSGSFAGYAVPLVAELGCEYMLTKTIFINCGITYLFGRGDVVEDNGDYGRVDFTGYNISAGVGLYFEF